MKCVEKKEPFDKNDPQIPLIVSEIVEYIERNGRKFNSIQNLTNFRTSRRGSVSNFGVSRRSERTKERV